MNGRQIRDFRLTRGWSIEQVADLARLTPHDVEAVEADRAPHLTPALLTALGAEECVLIAPPIATDFLRAVRHIAIRIDGDRLPIALAECMGILARFAAGEDPTKIMPALTAQSVHIEGDVEVDTNHPEITQQ